MHGATVRFISKYFTYSNVIFYLQLFDIRQLFQKRNKGVKQIHNTLNTVKSKKKPTLSETFGAEIIFFILAHLYIKCE